MILSPDRRAGQPDPRRWSGSTSSAAGSPIPTPCCSSLFLVMTWKYFGFHMMLYLAGRQGIPTELTEAAADRRRQRLAGVPARHAAAARADDPDQRVPVGHRHDPAVRPGLGAHRRRPDPLLRDHGRHHVPVRLQALPGRLRQRDQRGDVPASASSSPCSTSASCCAATSKARPPPWETSDDAARRAPAPAAAAACCTRSSWIVGAFIVVPLRLRACSAASRTTASSPTNPFGLPDPWVTGELHRHPRLGVVLAAARQQHAHRGAPPTVLVVARVGAGGVRLRPVRLPRPGAAVHAVHDRADVPVRGGDPAAVRPAAHVRACWTTRSA